MSFLDVPFFLRRPLASGGLLLTLSLGLVGASACSPGTSSPEDAGSDVPADGGEQDDAGEREDAGGAGDPDAGPGPCDDLDPVLGALALADGFTVVEHASLPEGLAAVVVVPEGGERRLFGLDFLENAVVDLGLWPSLSSSTKLFDVFPPDLEDEGAMVSWFLASDGTRLVSGYTGTFDPEIFVAPGALAIYDPTPGVEELRFVEAANNYAAAFVGDALVLNASSLGSLDEGMAIYALAGEPRVLARYEDPSSTYGGPLVATADGSLVIGGFDASTGLQHFRWISAADVRTALAEDALALADAEEILAAPALAASRFGDDFAYAHGDVFNPFEGVRRVSLASGDRGAVVDVLTATSTCSAVAVEILAPLDDDLLVSIRDEGGLRLVRIREDG